MGTNSVIHWIRKLREYGLSLTLPSTPFHPPGKKANPPRYWQTKVFPAALAFIASAVGGVPPRGQDVSSSTQPIPGNDFNTFAVCKSVDTGQSAVSVRADEELGESAAEEGTQASAEGATHPSGSLPSWKGEIGETTVVGTPAPLCSSVEGLSSSEETARRANITSNTQEWLPQQRQRQPKESLADTGTVAGRCLVVCPTGAEASVIVCISALVAFFPPPHVFTSSCMASANTDRQQPFSAPSPQTVAAIETHETDGGEVGPHLGGGKFSVLSRRGTEVTANIVTKAQLRTRFLLVQQECPWARPPRRLMQQLNEYFMTPGEHSWWTLSDRLLEGSNSAVDGPT